jgi:hypothetical protein
MRWEFIHKSLWTLGASLCTAFCLASEAKEPLQVTLRVPAAAETANSWPWMALGGIFLLLCVIALAARRRLPFGKGL